MSKVKIFVSYSHRDARHLEAEGLIGFLRGLERDAAVEFWIDDSLRAGDYWDDVIQHELRTSHIALLLVSQAFLDSAYCQQVEVSSLLSRAPGAGPHLFPVVLSACEWERHPWLASCQLLPGGQETLEEDYHEPGPQKRMYLKVRNELRALIERVAGALDQPASEKPAEVNAELRTVTLLHCCLSVDRQKYGLSAGEQLEFLYETAPLFKECCISELELLNGYVVQMSDAGQVLACFGYPEAQELDSVRAVRAGLAILRAAARLNQRLQQEWGTQLTVRAGIHTGQVIGKTGADTQQQLEHGQASQLTTQAMQAAPADALVVSQATYNLVAGFFTAEPSAVRLEADAPLALWVIGADLGLSTRFEATTAGRQLALVGRQRELALLLERRATAADRGQLVAVSAESGLGKSRLIQEARQEIRRAGGWVIDCQGSLFTSNSPLAPVVQALERWLGFRAGDGEAPRLRKLETSLTILNLPPDEVLPYLAELLQLPHPQQARLAQLPPRQLKEGTLEAILTVVLQAATLAPLTLVVEDLHWVDSSTLDCLNLLVQELPATTICLVVSARSGFSLPAGWQAQDYFALIKLDQLTRGQVAEMVGYLTQGRALPAEVFEAIYDKTEGYPLFVEELTRMVLGSELLTEHAGHYRLARPLGALSIPDTLHESLMARLNRLEGGRTVAQIGAVLGREFSFELIRAVAPLDADALKELLGRLVNSGLLYRKGLLARVGYTFKHALVQEALYESLLRRERRRYHQLAATALVAGGSTQLEQLAYHFREADAYEPAAEYGLRAAEKAARESASVEVLHHVGDALGALAHLPESPTRDHLELRLLLLQGPALQMTRGASAPEFALAYQRAQVLCRDSSDYETSFRVNMGLWGYYLIAARLTDSLLTANRLLAIGRAAAADGMYLEAYACHCNSYFWQGRLKEVVAYAERGLALYDLPTHHLAHALHFGIDPAARILSNLPSALWLSGSPEKAADCLPLLFGYLEQFTHLFSKGCLLHGICLYYTHLDEPEQALRYGQQLEELAARQGFPHWLGLARVVCGWANVRLHDDAGSLEAMLAGISLVTSGGFSITFSICAYLMVDAYLHLRQYPAALRYVDEALAALRHVEECLFLSELLRQQADLLQLLRPGSPEIELTRQRAEALAHSQGFSLPVCRLLPQPAGAAHA